MDVLVGEEVECEELGGPLCSSHQDLLSLSYTWMKCIKCVQR